MPAKNVQIGGTLINIQAIIRILNTFQNVDKDEDLQALANAVLQLHESPQHEAIEPLFRIVERFPEEETGCGVFWTILHTLEITPGYEPELVKSVLRQPCEFNVSMINRQMNGGVRRIGQTDLLDLLYRVRDHQLTPASVKRNAEEYIEQQRD